jgi:hypothetical protein
MNRVKRNAIRSQQNCGGSRAQPANQNARFSP